LKEYLIKNLPNTINVGPIFPPHVSRSDPFVIFPKPLLFDIDMEDYTNETSSNRPSHIPHIKRTCTCTTTCDACWILILRDPLVKCMEFLKIFMEFKHVIPVYSGRRGFHIWVMDHWELDKESREYIVNKMPAILDRNVTIQSTHLMKLFLVPHKTTGRVAIPILDVMEFVPSMSLDIDKEKMEEFKTFLLHSF
jgi:DNA primase small subunit